MITIRIRISIIVAVLRESRTWANMARLTLQLTVHVDRVQRGAAAAAA